MGEDRTSGRRVLAVATVAVAACVLLAVEVVMLVRAVSSSSDPVVGAPVREVPSAPSAMPPVGSWIDSTVGSDGEVAVRQWVRATRPVAQLDLAATVPDASAGAVRAREVDVSDMAGRRLAAAGVVGSGSQRLRLQRPVTSFFLSYTLSGPTMATTPSTVTGRALARVLGLSVAFPGEAGPTVRRVRVPGTVLNVACLDPAAPRDSSAGQPSPCGEAVGDGSWRVGLRGERRHDLLLVQLSTL